MVTITVSGLEKRWGETAALAGIDFVAKSGEMLVLLGPSGCGKSTTLRIVAGLETATGGSIRFGERDVGHLPPSARDISMVFQSYALYPHLSVRENVVFGLKVRRVAAAERERRLKRAAEMLSIGHLLDRRPAQLSGGQKQRVALGRAIVAEAPVCLMDEPLSNLDAQLRQEMRAEIRGLQQRLGMTMIYVTHDQTEAMTMADQVILLRDGRIEQKGTPREIYAAPASEFVGRFIGTPPMNLLRLDGGGALAALATRANPHAERGWSLGVRPEAVSIAAEGVPARVAASEYLGADTILRCDVDGQGLMVRADGAHDVEIGRDVKLVWRPQDQHLFDGTGRRV